MIVLLQFYDGSTAGCAGFSLLPVGSVFTTIETKGNLSRPITRDTGRVRAEGRAIVRGRQIISTEAQVLNRDGKVLAHGTSTLMVVDVGRTTEVGKWGER